MGIFTSRIYTHTSCNRTKEREKTQTCTLKKRCNNRSIYRGLSQPLAAGTIYTHTHLNVGHFEKARVKNGKRGCGCVRVFFLFFFSRHPNPESLSLGVYFRHQELSFSASVDVFRPARDSTAIVDDREKKKS